MPSSLPTAPKLKRAATTTRSRSSSCSRPMGRRPGCCPTSTQATRTSRSGSATWGSARRKPATSAWWNSQRYAVSSGCPSSETATSRRRRRCTNTRTRRRTSVASKPNHADYRELDPTRSGSLFLCSPLFLFHPHAGLFSRQANVSATGKDRWLRRSRRRPPPEQPLISQRLPWPIRSVRPGLCARRPRSRHRGCLIAS